MNVPVPHAYHKHVIGKQGANINKIREETGTKVGEGVLQCFMCQCVHVYSSARLQSLASQKYCGFSIFRSIRKMAYCVPRVTQKCRILHLIGVGSSHSPCCQRAQTLQIDIPNPELGHDYITVTGRQEGVHTARDAILAIHAEMVCVYCIDR